MAFGRTASSAPLILLSLLLVLASAAPPPPRTIEPPAAPEPAQLSPVESTTSDATRLGGTKVCHNSTPCGWAVYNGFSRVTLYFVQNACECSSDRQCTRVEDDLSARAFVYRCTPVSDGITTPGGASPPTNSRR